jgi:hypothetical protein
LLVWNGDPIYAPCGRALESSIAIGLAVFAATEKPGFDN